MNKIVLAEQGEALCVAVLEDGKLCDYARAEENAPGGELYLGRVERVIPGMQAAFVDIGLAHNGFLPLAERPAGMDARLTAGQDVLVQVKKVPAGEKGAYLTREIALAGRLCVLLPLSQGVSVSRRLTDDGSRAALLELGRTCVPEGMGLVVRADCQSADEDALRAEAGALCERWAQVHAQARRLRAPAHIPCARDALAALLTELRALDADACIAGDEALAARLRALYPGAPVTLADAPLAAHRVASQLEQAQRRRVWLKCGGYLVVDVCEALTVIDVNSGKFTGGKSGLSDTIDRLNREAAAEIARIARLRRLGGILIIDFVDMDTPAQREAVLDVLREALARDCVKTQVHGFTRLGLCEVTRRRVQAPLAASARKEEPRDA